MLLLAELLLELASELGSSGLVSELLLEQASELALEQASELGWWAVAEQVACYSIPMRKSQMQLSPPMTIGIHPRDTF